MAQKKLGINVLTAACQRIGLIFDDFDRVCISFSGGKDSGVLMHLVMDEAIRRGRTIGVLLIDMEAQYTETIRFAEEMFSLYRANIEPYWVSLPLSLTNSVSVYEPRWMCWEPGKDWVRQPPKIAITDESFFPFYHHGMEFEEFVHEFGIWYAQDNPLAQFIGIRTDESLNRLLKITVGHNREFHKGHRWALRQKSTERPIYSVHPIYDWATADVWRYHGKYGKPHNRIYDLMHQAGLSIHQQRLCQPYGVDQRKGLWLFHVLEPETWSKVVGRVNGANSGAEFVQYSGNVSGTIKITKPPGHTWKSFAYMLMASMPKDLAEHYENKVFQFLNFWSNQGGYYDLDGAFHGFYGYNIPEEVEPALEAKKKAPSWRRICKSLLRNDYWCKGLSFVQQESHAYDRYKQYMKRRKEKKQWASMI